MFTSIEGLLAGIGFTCATRPYSHDSAIQYKRPKKNGEIVRSLELRMSKPEAMTIEVMRELTRDFWSFVPARKHVRVEPVWRGLPKAKRGEARDEIRCPYWRRGHERTGVTVASWPLKDGRIACRVYARIKY